MNKQELVFCKKYQAKVNITNQRIYRHTTESRYIPDGYPGDVMSTTVNIVQIEMPEDRYRAMMEKERMLEQMFKQHSSVNKHPIDYFWDTFLNELITREQVPAVKIAYDKYKNLLELVRGNYD